MRILCLQLLHLRVRLIIISAGRLQKLSVYAKRTDISCQLLIKESTMRFTGITKCIKLFANSLPSDNRNVEPELFPCLRKFGISFYEFNPCEYDRNQQTTSLISYNTQCVAASSVAAIARSMTKLKQGRDLTQRESKERYLIPWNKC